MLSGESHGTGSVDRGDLFEAMHSLLSAAAAKAPLLLVIEDAHWADQSTRDLLVFLTRTLTDARVALAVTYRTDEMHRRHPLRSVVAELERLPHVTRLELEPLARDEVVAQLAAITGAPPDPDLVECIWDRSEGNPFYAEELLIAEEACQLLPPSVREGTLARVSALPEEHQRVLRVAAAAGRRVSDHLLAELAGLPEDTFAAIVRDLVGASLLVVDDTGDGYRFRHALLQEVVYDELLPGERVRLHVQIAEHLTAHHAGDAATAAELAHHWSRAKRNPEALAAWVAAGLEAEALGAPGDAVSHYERALELWDAVPDATERSALTKLDLLDRAANAARNVGRFDLGISLYRDAVAAAEAAGDMVRAGVLHQRLGRALFVADRPGAKEEFELGVDLVPAEPPSAERAGVLAGLAQVLMLTGHLGAARQRAEEALAVAAEVGARQVEGHARNTLGVVLANLGDAGGLDQLHQARAIAEELGETDDIGRAYVNLTQLLGEAGRWDELIALAAEARAVTRRLGIDRTHGVYIEMNINEGLVAVGRWDDAAAVQRSLEARLPAGHWDYFALNPLDADRGDFAVLHAALDRVVSIPDQETAVLQGLPSAFEAQVALAVWERRPADVRPVIEEMLRRIPLVRLAWKAAPVLWRAVSAEADVALLARSRRDQPTVDDAAATADRWLALLQEIATLDATQEGALPVVGSDAYITLAQAERHRLDGTDEPSHWLAAATRFDELHIVFPAAYARFRAGEAMLRAGDRAAAETQVQQAATVARQLGARPLVELIDQLATRGRLGPTSTGAGDDPTAGDDGLGLSAREREVLRLVAAGRTNREIAEELFISPKTASVHVSNILAKLGVAGRVEAAAIAHRVGLTA
jgi:DNA-binding CsgD family transcriptional regulator/tetratricopeptide (TPR) repeat protein